MQVWIIKAIHRKVEQPAINTQITELITLPTMGVRTSPEPEDANEDATDQNAPPSTPD